MFSYSNGNTSTFRNIYQKSQMLGAKTYLLSRHSTESVINLSGTDDVSAMTVSACHNAFRIADMIYSIILKVTINRTILNLPSQQYK